jgi:hypothetical protein
MKSFLQNAGVGVLSFAALLGVTGCQDSNESTVEQQAKKTAGAQVETTAPPKSQEEFGKRSQENNPFAKGAGTGYPGTGPARKK